MIYVYDDMKIWIPRNCETSKNIVKFICLRYLNSVLDVFFGWCFERKITADLKHGPFLFTFCFPGQESAVNSNDWFMMSGPLFFRGMLEIIVFIRLFGTKLLKVIILN